MTGLPYAMRLAGFGVRRPKAPNPGRSLAGTVVSLGGDVTAFKPGDEVCDSCDGSFAEYARAQPSMLALKPANASFEHAAAQTPAMAGPRSPCSPTQVWEKALETAPGHVAEVRRLIFDQLTKSQVHQLRDIGSRVIEGHRDAGAGTAGKLITEPRVRLLGAQVPCVRAPGRDSATEAERAGEPARSVPHVRD